jgi:hypothetical protein
MLQTSRARLARGAWMMRIVPGRALHTRHPLLLTGERLLREPAQPPRRGAHDANSGEMLRLDRERLPRTLTSQHFDPARGRRDRFSHHLEGDSQQRTGAAALFASCSHHFGQSSQQNRGYSQQLRGEMLRT